MRKGAVTFLVSGLETGPSVVAVHIRAGWSLPGVEGTYMRYAEAGDQTVGRSVCGLPTNRPEFALLPPHFQPGDTLAAAAIATCFGASLPATLHRIALFALASIVFHREFLVAKLPRKHPLFATPLFSQAGLLPALGTAVKGGCMPQPGKDAIRATGLFAFAELMGQLRDVHHDVRMMPAEMDADADDDGEDDEDDES